jgi:hypothetical protein
MKTKSIHSLIQNNRRGSTAHVITKPKTIRWGLGMAVFLAGLAMAADLRAAPAEFQLLGTIDGRANSWLDDSFGNFMSGDGSVIAGACGDNTGSERLFDGTRPFRWTLQGGMQSLHNPSIPGWYRLNALSRDGQMVAGTMSWWQPWYWNTNTPAQRFDTSGGFWALSEHAFPAGGWSGDPSSRHPLWMLDSLSTPLLLPSAPFPNGDVVALSADGRIAFGNANQAGNNSLCWPVRWLIDSSNTVEQYQTNLMPPGILIGGFMHCTPDGKTAIGSCQTNVSDQNYNFVWRESGGSTLIPGRDYTARCLSVNGFIGGSMNSGSPRHAVYGDITNGVRDLEVLAKTEWGLDFEPWYLFEVNGISDDGKILAITARNKQTGQFQASRFVVPDAVDPDAGKLNIFKATEDSVFLHWRGSGWILEGSTNLSVNPAVWNSLSTGTTNFTHYTTNAAAMFYRLRSP